MSLWLQEPTIEYCEKAGIGLVARPFYAISNFAYFGIALLLLRKSKDFLALAFAGASILVGSLSFIYDAQPNRLTQLFDLSGMFVFITLLLAVNLSRLLKMPLKSILFYLAPVPVISTVATSILAGVSGNIILGLLIISYIILETILKVKDINYSQWVMAFSFFVAGFAIWLLDFAKIFCMPGNYLNGRGVFHIFTAISVYLLYNFYASNQKEFGIK